MASPRGRSRPLIDVVMNGMAAVFIILMVYLVVALPDTDGPEPLRFLELVEPPVILAGQSFLYTFPVTGGVGKREFEVIGTLPSGLEFDPLSGTLHGAPESPPTTIRDFPIEAVVKDVRSQDRRAFRLRCCAAATPFDSDRTPLSLLRKEPDLPTGRVGQSYEAVLGSMGGVAPHRWYLVKGRLPPGLSLFNGRISGTPTLSGTFDLTAGVDHLPGSFRFNGRLHSWAGAGQRADHRIEILSALQDPETWPIGRVDEPLAVGLVQGGALPRERIECADMAPGLRLSRTGLLEGIPKQAGTFPVRCRLDRPKGRVTEPVQDLLILPQRPEPDIGTLYLDTRVDEEITVLIPYRGLREPVSIEAKSPLPEGLRFDDGRLEGKIAVRGRTEIQLEARDAVGRTLIGEATFQARSRRRPLKIETENEIAFLVNEPIGTGFSISGGEDVPVWRVSGRLPPGLELVSENGRLQGRIAKAGIWKIEVEAEDLLGGEKVTEEIQVRAVHGDPSLPIWSTRSLPTLFLTSLLSSI